MPRIPTHPTFARRTRRRTSLAALTLALGLFALGTDALAGDIIETTSGMQGNRKASTPPAAGDYAGSNFQVVEHRIDAVLYRIEGIADMQQIAGDKVVQVHYDPDTTPPGLIQGERLLDAGSYADAADVLGRVASSARTPPWAKAKAAYLGALAAASDGGAAAAVSAFSSFVSSHPKSYLVPQATMDLARAHVASGAFDKARSTFKSLGSMPGLSDTDRIEAEYGSAWLDEQVAARKNDKAGLEKAMKGYDSLLTKLRGRKNAADLIGKCTMGKASCLVALDRGNEAVSLCEKAIAGSSDPLVRAGAYTLLGRTTYLGAVKSGDADKLEEGLLHFLRVITLYSGAPGADDFAAESHYRAGEAFRELANDQKDQDEKRRLLSYASREWRECAQMYGHTEWGRRAGAGR